jgi:pyruvate/2-oxoglutarate dehydrogenase complex dihydrolipoamide acyltransferase (E2) component
VATSPAVGVFQPRREMTAGTRVRSGDRIGIVDVLGVPQEVVAPVDGVIGASYVQAGEAVEYGQELIRIELAGARPAEPPAEATAGAASAGSPGARTQDSGPTGAGAPGAEEA